MTLIKSNKALAKEIGVSERTITSWRSEGILAPAIVSDFRRTIIYNLEKVYECLNHRHRNTSRLKNPS